MFNDIEYVRWIMRDRWAARNAPANGGNRVLIAAVTSAELTDTEPGTPPTELANARWIPIGVPGDVHRALVAADRLDEPDTAPDDRVCRWMEERDWWYRFALPSVVAGDDERLRLVFEGLDTYADVYLDGAPVGSSRNMFRPLEIDVSDRLGGDGPHDVLVRFRAPLGEIDRAAVDRSYGLLMGPQTQMRKAQFGYGWDFGPRRPSIGIWRPVALVRDRIAAIDGVHARTVFLASDHSSAIVAVDIDVDAFASAVLEANVRLLGPDGEMLAERTTPVAEGAAGTEFRVRQPRLWWPNELGEQALHRVEVELVSGGATVAQHTLAVGIRTVVLDESSDPTGVESRFFRFVVNGTPIFAKGANWIPSQMAVGDIDESRYERLLTLARDAHMNMLRVWGGGIYEHDVFYDACDRLGLLVWQDFMFAAASYRDYDQAWLDEIAAEARYQVRRLRSHASLVLWCGNNEVEAVAPALPPGAPRGQRIFYEVLPDAVAAYDGVTGYLPTSPVFGNDAGPGSRQGDRHAWETWHGLGGDDAPDRSDSEAIDVRALVGGDALTSGTPEADAYLARISADRYLEDTGRFSSEFGILSACTTETAERYIGALDTPADIVIAHRCRDHLGPTNKLALVAEHALGRAVETLADLIAGSQQYQADGLKLGIEHYRSRWPYCAGTLVWQLNDCWPGFTWSLIDFDGHPKPAYDAVRAAYAPLERKDH